MSNYYNINADDRIRSRVIADVNGLQMHILEAGFETGDRPLVLMLHGFPELAYSFRMVLPVIADAGYHVVAPDQRGFGRTTGWSGGYDDDIAPFGMINLSRDALCLIRRLGHEHVHLLVGHDFGSIVAAHCALIRPDVFRAVVMMSAPVAGVAQLPMAARVAPDGQATREESDLSDEGEADSIHAALARLEPPRKHYQWYFATRAANADMADCSQGIHDFLRAYFHFKSGDWNGNQPHRLAAWTADEVAKMPHYYIMDRDSTMAQTVAPVMPSLEEIAGCDWLPDADLTVYSTEFARTGFQGGLNWYRARIELPVANETALFDGRKIPVPAAFIAGANDWGVYQRPHDLDAMENKFCERWLGTKLIDGAGHWVQQEQALAVATDLLDLLSELAQQS